jgi:hypothetical protein
VVHPALCSLPRILREAPVRVMFGGEFADQVCGSHFTLPDWARQTSLLRLVTNPEIAFKNPRLIGRWGRKRLATWRGRDELPFPRDLLEPDDNQEQALGLFHETVRQEYLEWWKKKRDELRADTGPWRHLAMDSGEHDGFVAMNWEACSALGVRRSFPFFNREVLELAYECHPAELYGPGTKRLLRAALDDDVPARNLYRADKGGWGARLGKLWQSRQEPMPEESLPHELVEVLRPEWFSQPPERLDYLQQRQLRRLMLFIERLRERRRERGKFANEEHMDRDI